MKTIVKIDRDDLNEVLDYLEVVNGEKKDYELCGTPKPKNHIWRTVKRIKGQMNKRA